MSDKINSTSEFVGRGTNAATIIKKRLNYKMNGKIHSNARCSGGIKGGGWHGGICPPLEKKWQKSICLANFWTFAPSETHFGPSVPTTKKKKKKKKKKNSGAATVIASIFDSSNTTIVFIKLNCFNIGLTNTKKKNGKFRKAKTHGNLPYRY